MFNLKFQPVAPGYDANISENIQANKLKFYALNTLAN